MAQISTSAQLVDLFSARSDDFGTVRLSVKQCQWLLNLLEREHRLGKVSNSHTVLHVESAARPEHKYDFVLYPNGAGFLRPESWTCPTCGKTHLDRLAGTITCSDCGSTFAANDILKAQYGKGV